MFTKDKPGSPGDVLAHHGVKGQRWGVRNDSRSSGNTNSKGARLKSKAGSTTRRVGNALSDTIFEMNTHSDAVQSEIVTKASRRLIKDLPRIKKRHGEYSKLSNRMRHPFAPEAKAYRADIKKTYLRHLERSANEITSKRGTLQYTLKEHGEPNTSKYYWNVSTQQVKHSAADGTFKVRPIFDDEGWVVDFEIMKDDVAQTMKRGLEFLIHAGIEGQR